MPVISLKPLNVIIIPNRWNKIKWMSFSAHTFFIIKQQMIPDRNWLVEADNMKILILSIWEDITNSKYWFFLAVTLA